MTRNCISDNTEFRELDSSATYSIKTKCPEKWLLVDRETGEVYSPDLSKEGLYSFNKITSDQDLVIDFVQSINEYKKESLSELLDNSSLVIPHRLPTLDMSSKTTKISSEVLKSQFYIFKSPVVQDSYSVLGFFRLNEMSSTYIYTLDNIQSAASRGKSLSLITDGDTVYLIEE